MNNLCLFFGNNRNQYYNIFSIRSIEQNKHFQNKKKLKFLDEIKLIISKKRDKKRYKLTLLI